MPLSYIQKDTARLTLVDQWSTQYFLDFLPLYNLRNHFPQLLLTPRAPAQKQLIVRSILMRPFIARQMGSYDRRHGSRIVTLCDPRVTILIGLLGINVIDSPLVTCRLFQGAQDSVL